MDFLPFLVGFFISKVRRGDLPPLLIAEAIKSDDTQLKGESIPFLIKGTWRLTFSSVKKKKNTK